MKAFKIIEGTAEEVSTEVTRLQGEGFKVKGELIYVGTYGHNAEAHYSQAVINLGKKDEDEVFDDKAEPEAQS